MASSESLITRRNLTAKKTITVIYGGLIEGNSTDPVESIEISWFKGTRDETIERHIVSCVGLHFPTDAMANLVLRDISDGSVVPISDQIPDGCRFRAAIVRQPKGKMPLSPSPVSSLIAPLNERVSRQAQNGLDLEDEASCLRMPLLLNTASSSEEAKASVNLEIQRGVSPRRHLSDTTETSRSLINAAMCGAIHSTLSPRHSHFARSKTPILQDVSIKHTNQNIKRAASVNGHGEIFFARLTKFERLSTHLANERTWLAWVRTICSTLSPAFSMLSLVDSEQKSKRWYFTVAAALLFSAAPLAYWIAWQRYRRVKHILDLPKMELRDEFRRMGLRNHAGYMLFVIALVGGAFVVVLTADWKE